MGGRRHGLARRRFAHKRGRAGAAHPRIGQRQIMMRPQRQFRFAFRLIGHDDLGHQQAAGRSHEAGGKQIVDPDPHGGIGGQNGAGDPRHAAGHHRKQLRGVERGEIRADHQRAFALADEDIGRRAQAFDLGDARHLFNRAADPADDELHDAQIIEDRHQTGEEDDDRQRGDREARAADIGTGERPEDEIGARLRIAEQVRHTPRHARDDRAASRYVEHQQRDPRLQQEGRAHHARTNGAAVG